MKTETLENRTPETAEQIEVDQFEAAVGALLDKRDAAQAERFTKKIEALTGPVATPAAAAADPAPRTDRGGENVAISRYQPTDVLYGDLERTWPRMATVRNAESDHWGGQWLRAKAAGDIALMRLAEAKGNEAFERGFGRANILEGVFDTDPTSVLTGSGASNLPQPMQAVALIARQAAAVLAPLLSNFTTTGSTLRVPTSGAVTADTASEGAAVGDAPPAFTSEMLILHKLGARMTVSTEMLADSAFNLMQLLSQSAGEGIGAAEDLQICTTDGATPNLTEAIAGGNVAEATGGAMVYADLVTLFFALGKAYQPRSTWLAGTAVMTLLSNLADTTGQPILKVAQQPNVVSDIPSAIGSIFGRPIYHVPMPANVLLLGDLRSQAFVRKGGIEAAMSTDVGFASDTVQFKFTERVDTRIIDDVGMKQIDFTS